jgi:indolepyruvate ferredoxin oxidoreductase beta subunit
MSAPGITVRGARPDRPITIAIMAMGGQGGGVLVDWIVDLAENNGYLAQSTSVPGVAQRTGATIYYVELLNAAHGQARGAQPVFALMPVPGEVDIVIAAELMEAGRAIQRGLVSHERTTLIASTHRDFGTLEKVVPGNGIADTAAVLEAGTRYAQRFLHDDMQQLARREGSVISAALFGALAGSGELPFTDDAFRDTIRRAGVGAEPSLRAWQAGCNAIREPIRTAAEQPPLPGDPAPLPARAASPEVERLRERIVAEFPAVAHPMLGAGLQRVLEYQDLEYGAEYLNRVAHVHRTAAGSGGEAHGHLATIEAARWVAVAMAYDDIIRVADLKSRSERFERIRREVGASDSEVVGATEYFHPRLEEVTSLLPVGLAHKIEQSPGLSAWIERRLSKGRRVRSHTITGQLMLHALASLRFMRRSSLRHQREQQHLEAWLARVEQAFAHDYRFAVEVIRLRRAIKGYSDTHARGMSRFDRLMRAAAQLQGRPDAADALASLLAASLADAQGAALERQRQALALGPI